MCIYIYKYRCMCVYIYIDMEDYVGIYIIPGSSWADSRKPNVRSYSSVINACAKTGKAEEAVQWLERLEDSGLQSDAIVYSSVTLC